MAFTSGNISEDTRNTSLKEYKRPYVHSSVICNTKLWKQRKCPSGDEWGKAAVHSHGRALLGHREEENPTLCDTWRDLGRMMLSEVSQSEKDKYHVISLMCGI